MYKILEKAKPKAENEEEDSDLFGESSEVVVYIKL